MYFLDILCDVRTFNIHVDLYGFPLFSLLNVFLFLFYVRYYDFVS